jgi:hypothetical protein
MKTAIIAASRTNYQKIHHSQATISDIHNLKQELYTARKLKLESKLVISNIGFTMTVDNRTYFQ